MLDAICLLVLIVSLSKMAYKSGELKRLANQIIFGIIYMGAIALIILFYLMVKFLNGEI